MHKAFKMFCLFIMKQIRSLPIVVVISLIYWDRTLQSWWMRDGLAYLSYEFWLFFECICIPKRHYASNLRSCKHVLNSWLWIDNWWAQYKSPEKLYDYKHFELSCSCPHHRHSCNHFLRNTGAILVGSFLFYCTYHYDWGASRYLVVCKKCDTFGTFPFASCQSSDSHRMKWKKRFLRTVIV